MKSSTFELGLKYRECRGKQGRKWMRFGRHEISGGTVILSLGQLPTTNCYRVESFTRRRQNFALWLDY
jgi:hypothetical protein